MAGKMTTKYTIYSVHAPGQHGAGTAADAPVVVEMSTHGGSVIHQIHTLIYGHQYSKHVLSVGLSCGKETG